MQNRPGKPSERALTGRNKISKPRNKVAPTRNNVATPAKAGNQAAGAAQPSNPPTPAAEARNPCHGLLRASGSLSVGRDASRGGRGDSPAPNPQREVPSTGKSRASRHQLEDHPRATSSTRSSNQLAPIPRTDPSKDLAAAKPQARIDEEQDANKGKREEGRGGEIAPAAIRRSAAKRAAPGRLRQDQCKAEKLGTYVAQPGAAPNPVGQKKAARVKCGRPSDRNAWGRAIATRRRAHRPSSDKASSAATRPKGRCEAAPQDAEHIARAMRHRATSTAAGSRQRGQQLGALAARTCDAQRARHEPPLPPPDLGGASNRTSKEDQKSG
jgi:hypothetical protein